MSTFGTVTFLRQQRTWEITCEPHVAIRLKRVFSKISSSSHGTHHLSDNPEICRDILWFISRYPLKLPPLDESYLKHQAQQHQDALSLVHQLLEGRMRPRAFKMLLPPEEHQRVAAEMTLTLGGLLNSDPLGRGKTVAAIATFCDPRTLPALVVVPGHLQRQWVSEVKKFTNLGWHIIKQAEPYDLRGTDNKSKNGNGFARKLPEVIIGTYSKLSRWAETLAPVVKSVVFDEVVELHTGLEGKSKKYAAAKHIAENVDYRTGLSGLPIAGYGAEIFNIIDCLRPGALGTLNEFHDEWCSSIGNGKWAVNDPDALGTYLLASGLMVRRPGPPGRGLQKIPTIIPCDLKALHKVSKSCEELARLILKQGAEGRRGEKMLAAREFSWKLREATGIGKAVYVADFVRILIEQGESVLLTGWHHAVYEIWKDRFADLEPVWFTGLQSDAKKEVSKERFFAKKTPLMIMSNRSGSGTNGCEEVCHIAVHGELDWSPEKHGQIDGRLDRRGQLYKVLAYYMLAEVGSDPVLSDVLGIKKAQSDGIMSPHAKLVEELTYDPHHIEKLAKAYLKQLKRQ